MMSETQPSNLSDTQPRKIKKQPLRAGFWISLLILISALALGTTAGYGEGVRERVNAEATLDAQQFSEQFALAQQDFDAGRYDNARQRIEHILGLDPNYPGAAAMLADVLVKQSITPSPVPTATPTITPTPDLRNQDAIFAQAQQQAQGKDWTGLLGSLDSLRKADPTYKVVQVDGWYYAALRNRGVDQIMGQGAYAQTTNMEGGIYDLTLAERFGPLDGYADGLRNFARMYITASSFWDVNWPQAVDYFRQVYQFAPNLRDASNVTAGQRLHEALLKYGDQMSASAKMKDRCVALDLWSEAGNISQLNGEYSTKWNQLNNECNPPTEVPTAVVVPPTADPNAGVPTVDPNLTPTGP
jgi:tetratricopeptide (TPR) repeat protein